MCGILGKINFDSTAIANELLENAAKIIHHRGPDDFGIWNEQGCGLAHRRLSIIDLSSGGHQPMHSANGRYVCVFNGEIYNFKDIKKSLGSSIQWKSHSDTEVLLEGWSLMGKEILNQLDGMYAFALWDKQQRKLIVARDRMGEKPFYYFWNKKQFGFASRPKPLFTLFPEISKEYSLQAMRYFLESGYVPAPYSIHKEIFKLPAAHYLEVDEKSLVIKPYWNFQSIPTNSAWNRRSENDLLDELDDIVSRTVKQRMISDVPLGAFLSGGIDSSLMVAMMKKHSNSSVKTFTIGFNERSYDESGDAEKIAKHLGTSHQCEHLKVDDLLNLLPTFLKNYDEPFFDSAAFPTLAVSRLARKHVTVSITGDGGDELFGGYHYYKIAKLLNPLFSSPTFFRKILSSSVKVFPKHQLKLLSAALKQSTSSRAFAFSRSIAKDFHQILTSDVLQQTKSMGDLFEDTARSFPKGLHASEEAMRLDSLFTLNDDYLQKTDVASMAFSLESRAPLLGKEVVEWAMKLPTKWKIRNTENKYLLRRLAYRYVPEKILNKPKRGFGVPIDTWLRGPLKQWTHDHLFNNEYFNGLPLDQKAVQSLFKLHQSGARNVHPLLWAILMLLEFNVRLKHGDLGK